MRPCRSGETNVHLVAPLQTDPHQSFVKLLYPEKNWDQGQR